jgi:hypothetical protein
LNFKNLTYRQKNTYLLLATVVFAIIAYKAAIQTTIQLYQDNAKMESKIKKAENAPQGIAELRKSLDGLNKKLNHYLIDTTKEHQHTLEVVSEFCSKKKMIVKELPKRTVTVDKDFTIITSVLTIEGSYIELLSLLRELEYVQRIGRVSAVSWQSNVDTKTKRTVLSMILYLQNITVNKEKTNEDENAI